VVCVLGPGCVSSGEGFAKMMKCLPHVATLGSPTRGSSGNPRPFTLPGVPVTVMYSRWVDMLPDGTPVEGRGVPPEILVDLPETSYEHADPTWERALKVLREKVRAAR
jgi:C-terminal processing protease CtpA/Prc